MIASVSRPLRAAALLLAAVLAGGCGERPPVYSTQQGFRGTGMQNVVNPRLAEEKAAALPAVPPDTPPAPADGPKAGQVYQNVKVLGDLSVAEFARHMVAITQWVAPEQGCGYCHNLQNLADDGKYQKVVSRRMIEMTRHLNAEWRPHVAATGVTCLTCHRGQPVPPRVWYQDAGNKANVQPMIGNDFGQNKAVPSVALTSLPHDPFTSKLMGAEPIRIYAKTALPQDVRGGPPIQSAERTYALMIHFSESLGVNCTACHNTQSFQGWVPRKVQAWHGIQMARDINNNYLSPLTGVFPAERKGPLGDVAKTYCATCHQGVNKPLNGLQQARLYAGLQGVPSAAAAAAALPPPPVDFGGPVPLSPATPTPLPGLSSPTPPRVVTVSDAGGMQVGGGVAAMPATPAAPAAPTATATATAAMPSPSAPAVVMPVASAATQSGTASAPAAATGNAPAALASAAVPAGAAPGAFAATLYFGVGSSQLGGDQAAEVQRIAAALAARPGSVAAVSGFHSASGDLATNQTLAKNRAMAVRDALVAGGIDTARVRLERPQQAEANAAGEDGRARRVEVRVQ